MNRKRIVSYTACLVVLVTVAALAGAPAAAQPTITRGIDAFQTSTNPSAPTRADFSVVPLPAGFFCMGSAPFTGQIQLQGVPLTTLPPGVTANGDTIVERLSDGVFSGGSATFPVQIRAVQLASASLLTIPCPGQPDSHWRVSACLCGNQPVTQVRAQVDQACGCGHFDGQLNLNVCLTFTEASSGAVLGPVQQAIGLTIAQMPWCPTPGRGEPVVNGSFLVQGCDGKQLSLPGTTNFFPGWTCAEQGSGLDCWQQYANFTECHSAYDPNDPFHKHCTNPICGRGN